jgi:hypothetical protein
MNDPSMLSEPDDAVRGRILALTGAVVRRRRYARYAAAVLAVVAAWGIGLVTPRFWEAGAAAPPRGVGPPAMPAPTPPSVAPTDFESRAAFATTVGERGALLKRAGDRYLSELGDVEGALRCYRELLSLHSRDERERPDAEDTWLLAALRRGSD